MSASEDSMTEGLMDHGSSVVEYNAKLVNCMFPEDVNGAEVRSVTKEISLNDDNVRMNELYKKVNATWYNRAFSPITPGSLRGSTFTLISTALGAGVLSLPKMYENTGVGLGTIYIILAGLSALWSMYLLSKCSFKTNCTRYSDAVLNLLGTKWSFVLQIVLIIYVFGSLVSYLITINQFVAGIAQSFGLISVEESVAWYTLGSPDYYKSYITILVVALLEFPICSIKNLSSLRYMTVFGVGAIAYIITVVVIEAPILYNQLPKGEDIVYFKFGWEAVTGWAVCAFAFTCHVNVFPVISELQRPMQRRTNKIFNRCITVETIMFLSMGIAGYLSTLSATPDLFVNRNAVVGPHDFWMTIGKIGMAINLFLVVPVNLNPCRMQLLVLLRKEKAKSQALHYGITGGIILASAGLAVVFPNIYSAFGILGGFFATMISYTFPALIYLKCTNLKKGHYKRWLVYLIGSVTTIFGFASAIVVILQKAGVIPTASS